MASVKQTLPVSPRSDRRLPFEPDGLPCAEDVLLAWLLWLPQGVDPGEAALVEIERMPPPERDGPAQRQIRNLLLEVSRAAQGNLATSRMRARGSRRRRTDVT
jgi:hypothetical protein